ncbi:MAG: hypothetical protein GX963_11150, partial [Bacteroidales bacterium]|nr:hypothetical protein [Bacteroidales bacterium]
REDTTLKLIYPRIDDTGVSIPLQGGDGNYSVKSHDEKVVTAKMISPIDLHLKVVGLGETTVTITDQSKNSLILHIIVDYETRTYVVVKHDIKIAGDELTEDEINAIQEEYIKTIPVKEGGGYQFIFTDRFNNKGEGKGKAVLYINEFGKEGKETSFEIVEVDNQFFPESSSFGYEILIDDEKRVFNPGKYKYTPSIKSKALVTNHIALMEDITEKVKKEYPKAEKVFTFQVIITK